MTTGTCLSRWETCLGDDTHSPPSPTTPTFFPGPAPFLTSGEKTVRPPHSLRTRYQLLCVLHDMKHAHRSSLDGRDGIGDGEDETLLRPDVGGVPSLVLLLIGPCAVFSNARFFRRGTYKGCCSRGQGQGSSSLDQCQPNTRAKEQSPHRSRSYKPCIPHSSRPAHRPQLAGRP